MLLRKQSLNTAAMSVSGTNITRDDEGDLPARNFIQGLANNQDCYRLDFSPTNDLTNSRGPPESHSNLRITSHAASMIFSLRRALSSANSKSKSLFDLSTATTNATETKEPHYIHKLIRKILKSSSNTSRNPRNAQSTPSNSTFHIDNAHHIAHLYMHPLLPIRQGAIRSLVLRHAERLDQYYSSQWLKQAFDKNGNFYRFSSILS